MNRSGLIYPEYPCVNRFPLSCDQPCVTVKELPESKYCMSCGFPVILSPGQQIKGRRSIYKVVRYLGSRGNGRLYSAVRLGDNVPVNLKEFLLPNRCFNQAEKSQCQDSFFNAAGLHPSDGKSQDFRIILNLEGIVDLNTERCYLITSFLENSLTLTQYLDQNGPMSVEHIHEFLKQSLQTLQFLHNQKFTTLSTGTVQGICHNNISLDSLLITPKNNSFYIYFCDFAIWESLFHPSGNKNINPSESKDLVDLALVAGSLWTGQITTIESVDFPTTKNLATSSNDELMQQFLRRLLGQTSSFDNASAAYQALPSLKAPLEELSHSDSLHSQEVSSKKHHFWLFILLIFLLSGIGALLWIFKFSNSPKQPLDYQAYNQLSDRFSDITNLPPGRINYAGNNTWTHVLSKKPNISTLSLDQELLERIKTPKFDFQPSKASFSNPDIKQKTNASLEAIRQRTAQFAIASLTSHQQSQNGNDWQSKRIAYDGLLVFVSLSRHPKSPFNGLGGKISLDNLRRLYTGDIKNWQQLGGPDLKVTLHIPTEDEAIQHFIDLVLKNDPSAIDAFKQAVKNGRVDTTETIRQMKLETKGDELDEGIISFGLLSRTWDQCTIYPLALYRQGEKPTQAFINFTGKVLSPIDNLCDKRTYFADPKQFASNRYPLSYELHVIYPYNDFVSKPGVKFAELLKTREGQCLIREVGLVPLQAVPKNCRQQTSPTP